MADSDSTVKTNIEVNLTKDDSGKAVAAIDSVKTATESIGGGAEEAGEKIRIPQRELRMLAHQLGHDIPGASELMRAGFVASTEPMLAGIFVLIGAIELIRKSFEASNKAQAESISQAHDLREESIQLADDLKNVMAKATTDATVELMKLNKGYDEFARTLKVATEALENHARATNELADANENAAISRIKLQEAENLISPAQAEGQIARIKLAAQIAKENAENSKLEAEAKMKSVAAGKASEEEAATREEIAARRSKSGDLGNIDLSIASTKAEIRVRDKNQDALEKKAEAAELDLANMHNQEAMGMVKSEAQRNAIRQAAESARQEANMNGEIEKQHLEELQNKREIIKADVDSMVEHAASMRKHSRALSDEADDINARLAVKKSGESATNPILASNVETENLTRDISEGNRILTEHHLRTASDASTLIQSLGRVVAKNAEERRKINDDIADLMKLIDRTGR